MQFETQNNRYYFHNKTGQIFQYSDNDDLCNKKKLYDSLAIEANEALPITASGIKQYLYDEGNGFKQLILETTQACNLRCKYCIFSEHYPHTRSHNDVMMSIETMKKAVDFYFTEYSKVSEINPMKKPIVSFYGGEPLLAFKNIKRLLEYTEETYKNEKPIYNITTNGVFFTDEVQDILMKYNFSILVSLDSYQSNHDRNRIDTKGNPTFNEIIRNLKRYYKKYGKGNVSISCCYDYSTNFIKLKEFFDEFEFDVVSLTQVQSSRSDYYTQFTEEEKNNFWNGYEKAKHELFEMAKNDEINKDTFVYKYFSALYSTLAYHRMILENNSHLRRFTGTCIPGEKLFVNSLGEFKVCEKVNHTESIGNINTGLNFFYIAKMMEDYTNSIKEHCSRCDISRICQLCFKDIIIENGRHTNKNICNEHKETLRKLYSEYATLLEYKPSLFDEMTSDYYKHLEKIGEMI
ncbi:TPA: radical SAM protein [Streptococcus pyogenes]|uniref:radical SAM protein n=1 Tax=Enterococcus faecalis TaxID=1351 RepID=UPI002B739E7D|nr:radical SAM protein [Streptococcus pyogenes]